MHVVYLNATSSNMVFIFQKIKTTNFSEMQLTFHQYFYLLKHGFHPMKYGFHHMKCGFHALKYGLHLMKYGFHVMKYGLHLMKYGFQFSKMVFIFTVMNPKIGPVTITKLFEMIYISCKIKKGPVQIFAHSFDFFHYKILTVAKVSIICLTGSLADDLEILP